MAYLGNTPQQKFLQRFFYTATEGQTTFSGADNNGVTLGYEDARYIDVFLNGVKLKETDDYTATTRTSVVLTAGATLDDVLEIIVQGIFSAADTVSAARGGHYNGPINVNSSLVVTGNINVGGQLVSTSMFKNRLINGMMQINQREANTATDDTYAYDRWNVLTEGGIVTISSTPYANLTNTIPAMMRIRQNITANQRFGVEQIVEYINCRDLRNEVCTLSASVMCSNTTNIRYAILEWTGASDTVTSDVANNWNSAVYTTTAFFPPTGITVANTGVVSLSSNVITDIKLTATMSASLNNAIVFFWTEVPQANTVALDISMVQLEKGGEKTSYEFRHIGHELKMCKRYFQRYGDSGVIVFAVYSTTGNDGYQTYTLQEEMRANPTVTKFGNWTVSNGGQPTITAYRNMFRVTQTVTSTGMAYSQGGTGFYVTFTIEL